MLLKHFLTYEGYITCYSFFFCEELFWYSRPLVKECIPNNYFSYFSTKIYVVGAQKNSLNEMVLLSTQKTCYN